MLLWIEMGLLCRECGYNWLITGKGEKNGHGINACWDDAISCDISRRFNWSMVAPILCYLSLFLMAPLLCQAWFSTHSSALRDGSHAPWFEAVADVWRSTNHRDQVSSRKEIAKFVNSSVSHLWFVCSVNYFGFFNAMWITFVFSGKYLNKVTGAYEARSINCDKWIKMEWQPACRIPGFFDAKNHQVCCSAAENLRALMALMLSTRVDLWMSLIWHSAMDSKPRA